MRQKAPFFAALTVFFVAIAAIAGALAIEALGYAPCELCLKERMPYYAAIPIAALTAVCAARGKASVARLGLFGLVLIFSASAVFGAYHAGMEWGFWPGPKDCSGAFERAASPETFLQQLQNVQVVRCDAPALKILGLSLAAWNAVMSIGLAGVAVLAFRLGRRPID
ncbi:MAG TPA: disulfide bond formation protein B [Methylocella sp.]|nr:disulfide bond formation protein B [Methylocella sp.]